MRKIVAALYMSLDGVVDTESGWPDPYINDEVIAEIGATVAAADAALLGRRTYLDFAAVWPDRGCENPIAEFLNSSPKYVVTRTLKTLHWERSHRLRGELHDELQQLKSEPGQNLLALGSPTLVSALLHDGLLDEINLNIVPIVLGRGQRLFDEAPDRAPLRLISSKALRNGVLTASYRPAER